VASSTKNDFSPHIPEWKLRYQDVSFCFLLNPYSHKNSKSLDHFVQELLHPLNLPIDPSSISENGLLQRRILIILNRSHNKIGAREN